jgi:multimeric flavodoxin WrbA
MKIMVFASSPNSDGLTQACADAVCEGVRAAGLEADLVRLNDERIGLCHACAQGWGTCRTEHRCQVLDGFQDLHKRAKEADGYAVVSPVYFGELSESAKVFFDRLRRCEATRGTSRSWPTSRCWPWPPPAGAGEGRRAAWTR